MHDLRRTLDTLIHAALRAADPREAIRRHLTRDGDRLYIDRQRYDLSTFTDVRLIAAGKASLPMATEVTGVLGGHLASATIVTKHGHAADPTGQAQQHLTLIEAGHPIPDEHSLRGGLAVCDALQNCTERTLVITCVSGGASALLVAPYEGITLGTVRAINDALLRSGADIREMNAVRSRLDRLKGGGLVRLAQPAKVVSLILSDVVGDPLDVIASGLTNDARAHNVLVGNNQQACNAVADAARDIGLVPHVVTTELRGEARDAAGRITTDVLSPPALSQGERTRTHGQCLIYGGETTVTIRGDGKGGRNQELALAAAIAFSQSPLAQAGREDLPEPGPGLAAREPLSRPRGPWPLNHPSKGGIGPPFEGLGWAGPRFGIAALGTDGTDGPTDAAGAFAFPDTVARGHDKGLDARSYLQRNDSYHFFAPLGDLIMTGPTGTNVADVVIAVALAG